MCRKLRPPMILSLETELVQVGGDLIHGCTACFRCFKNKDGRCVLAGDIVNDCIAKMRKADGIILAMSATRSAPAPVTATHFFPTGAR